LSPASELQFNAMTFVKTNGGVLLCLIPLQDKKLPPFKLLSRINNICAVLLISAITIKHSLKSHGPWHQAAAF
jgi:hypothetical protein